MELPPIPKKIVCPCKNMANLSNKPLLDQKIVQEMKFTRHIKANKSIKEKKLYQYTNKFKRQAREYTQALPKSDFLPFLLFSIVLSPPPLSQACYCICEQCQILKAIVYFFPAKLSKEYKNCCIHYLTDSNSVLDKMCWCYQSTHKAPYYDFVFDNQENFRCNKCSKRTSLHLL